ncbi:unnamed protein product [Absidia cylindrospora]
MASEVKDVEKVDIATINSIEIIEKDESNLREPPNGGIGWLVVVGCFCGLFATQGYGYSWGVYLNYYNTHVYPGEMTNLTWIGSLWFALTNITGPFHVYLCGKVGYKWMLGVACILSGFSMMMASISSSIWHLYLTQGVLSGIASLLAWFPCISGPQQWFSSRRGMAVGLAISGWIGIGGLVISNVIRAAIDSVGYQWSLRILGFMQMGLLAISFLTVKQLNPPSSFVPSYADSLGLSPIISTNLSGVMSGLMVVGKITNGVLSDYVGRRNITFMVTIMCGVVCLAVWYTAETAASLWAFVVLFGLFGGGYVTCISSVIIECVGVQLVESANGWLYFAWIFGGLFGQPISAAIIDHNGGSYKGAIIFGGVLFIFAGLMAALLRFMQSGPKLFVNV